MKGAQKGLGWLGGTAPGCLAPCTRYTTARTLCNPYLRLRPLRNLFLSGGKAFHHPAALYSPALPTSVRGLASGLAPAADSRGDVPASETISPPRAAATCSAATSPTGGSFFLRLVGLEGQGVQVLKECGLMCELCSPPVASWGKLQAVPTCPGSTVCWQLGPSTQGAANSPQVQLGQDAALFLLRVAMGGGRARAIAARRAGQLCGGKQGCREASALQSLGMGRQGSSGGPLSAGQKASLIPSSTHRIAVCVLE